MRAQVRVLRPDCFATAERLLRGMAPHALVATGAGAAEHVRQLAAVAGAAAGAAAAAAAVVRRARHRSLRRRCPPPRPRAYRV
jgi:hypothetical protein